MRTMERRGDLAGFDIVLAHAEAGARTEPHGSATPLPAWMGRLGSLLGLKARQPDRGSHGSAPLETSAPRT